MESCLAPLSAGGGRTELPLGVKLEHGEMVTTFICTMEEVMAEGYGLGTRALLARARDSEETCKWYAHVQLYMLMLFSRPVRDDKPLKPTSEYTSLGLGSKLVFVQKKFHRVCRTSNSASFVVHVSRSFSSLCHYTYNRVSPTRKHLVAFQEAFKGTLSRKSFEADVGVMQFLYEEYESVAEDKKNNGSLWENRRQRTGFGPKTKNGRCREPRSVNANRLIKFMRKLLEKNGLDPVMGKWMRRI